VVQELLAEAGVEGVHRALVRPQPRGVELGADWDELKSPENYVGYQRTEGCASPAGPVRDEPLAPFGERALGFVHGYKADLDRHRAAMRTVKHELMMRNYALTEVRILDLLIWSVKPAT
jgi:hypothetical protein